MKPTTDKRARWVQCRLSLAGATIAVPLCAAGLYIDVGNNYAIGSAYLAKLGEVMALAAAAFAGAPTIAAIIGRWGIVTLATTALAGMLTIAAAYLSYTTSLAGKIDGVTTQRQQAETARKKRDRAQGELERAEGEARAAGEALSSAALKDQRGEALGRVQRETIERGGCPATVKRDGKTVESECRKAEALAASLLERIGKAEARERAEVRAQSARRELAEVEGVADTAEPQQNLAAVDLAMSYDIAPERAAKIIARGLAILGIALTVGLGVMSHTAASLTMAAFGIVPLTRRRPTTAPDPKPQPKLRRESKAGRKPITAEKRMKQFVAEELEVVEGVANTGAAVMAAFDAWRVKRCPELPEQSANKLADALKDAGIARQKIGGKVRYFVQIKGNSTQGFPAKPARKPAKAAPAAGRLH